MGITWWFDLIVCWPVVRSQASLKILERIEIAEGSVHKGVDDSVRSPSVILRFVLLTSSVFCPCVLAHTDIPCLARGRLREPFG